MPNEVSINPFRCRMWAGHERLDELIDEDSCKSEIESFMAHGQRLPALGRPLKGDINYDVELIYGARRLFVARHLNVPLRVEVRPLTDREAIIALDIENRQRKDLSPYERGRSFNRWLRDGQFSSQEELARFLNISASQVSRLIKLAQLPSVVVSAFSSPFDICENWGRTLKDMWEAPDKQKRLIAASRALARDPQPRPGATVFRRLTSCPGERVSGDISAAATHDEVIKDADGKPLFRVRVHRSDTALLLPTNAVSAVTLAEIKREVAAILHRARAEVIDRTTADSTKRLPAPTLTSRSESRVI